MWGFTVRGSRRPNRTAIYRPPLLWPSTLCLSRSPELLNRRPRGPLCWVMAFFTASYQRLISNSSGPQWPLRPGVAFPTTPYLLTPAPTLTVTHQGLQEPLRPDVAFPTTSRHSVSNSLTATVLTSVLTELYNSSTPIQSPTRSLKWHDWSSSSGNNCHAVHRSLSSGTSVYECTMGIFFTSSHFISQFPPTQFPLITVIRMCHFLPVHHSEWHFWPGRRSKYHITK